MTERRHSPRKRQFLGGRILFNERCSTFDCLVRDLSSEGARLNLQSTAGVPGYFELTLPARQEKRRARLVWRDETQAGVTFLDGAQAKAPGTSRSS